MDADRGWFRRPPPRFVKYLPSPRGRGRSIAQPISAKEIEWRLLEALGAFNRLPERSATARACIYDVLQHGPFLHRGVPKLQAPAIAPGEVEVHSISMRVDEWNELETAGRANRIHNRSATLRAFLHATLRLTPRTLRDLTQEIPKTNHQDSDGRFD